jgi:hypothetical protein
VKEPIVADTTKPDPTVAETVSSELSEQILAQQKEYGQWVAAQQIFTPHGALAYNRGDAVPISNVEQHQYDKLGWVVKNGSKAHQELLES